MTVDSFYFSETYEPDGEVDYPFQIESIGEAAIRVYLILEDGTRIRLAETPEE